MTGGEALALGRRAVVCRGWRWPPDGALPMLPRPPLAEALELPYYGDTPDLRDPRAVGWLLGLVRGAYHEPLLYVRPGRSGWVVARYREGDRCPWLGVWGWNPPAGTEIVCPIEAEALVAALESA